MSSVSKTAVGTYRVQWYDNQGHKRQKNFKTRDAAKKYAALLELTPDQRRARLTIRQVLEEYRDTVAVKKRGARAEVMRINCFLQRPFADTTLSTLTPKVLQAYVDERAEEPSKKYKGKVAPATIRREMQSLSAAFSWAVRKGLITENPCKGVVRPSAPEPRERVATEEDIKRLMEACQWNGESVPSSLCQLTVAAFIFACRTGMRSGEILRIEETWVEGRVIHLPKEATKTESKRSVALCKDALRILNLVRMMGEKPRIFGALTDHTRDVLWRRVRDGAGLGPVTDSQGRVVKEGLNFHDSRATFATWAASPDPKTGAPRLDVLALAKQTGHKNLKILQGYYRATADEIADRLDACT